MNRKQKKKGGHSWLKIAPLLAVLAIGAAVFLFAVNRWSVTVTLKGGAAVNVEYGSKYQDAGAEARLHGSLVFQKGWPVNVTTEGSVNLSQTGENTLVYSAEKFGLKGSAQRTVTVVDTKGPGIVLVMDEAAYTIPGEAYQEEGFLAIDNCDGDLTEQVEREEKDGIVTYTVTDSAGNTTEVTREIVYWDPIPPELTLLGENSLSFEVGTAYEEPGYTATDNCDGDLTSAVEVSGSVDPSKVGSYTLTYSATDRYDNTTTVQRTICCVDSTPPELTLKGGKRVTLTAGTSYQEPGYTADDNYDGDLTSSVEVSGSVDASSPGTYTLTYSVTDSAGNAATAKRTVVVEAAAEPDTQEALRQPDTVNPTGKIVYLTFDDGPGKYTQKLLDILDKYNVKATFFTVNTKYIDLIQQEAAAGHTVAIHSATHDYAKIYASEEAYFADLKKQQQIIYEKTGIMSTLVRFPGGSSNTISRRYCPGIMTALTKKLDSMGYQYFDWNVVSGDAGETTSTDVVYQNVINGIQNHDVSIVLQHDIKGFSVNAVERIIVWGLEHGYTFLPLSETSPTAHQKVNN